MATNLQLPDHLKVKHDLETMSVTTDADALRCGVAKTKNCTNCPTDDNLETATCSSDDADANDDEKRCEIKTLQNPLLPSSQAFKQQNNIHEGKDNHSNEEDHIYETTSTLPKRCLDSPYWIVFLASLFYFFSQGVDGFFQSQTYSFALCGPLKLETYYASHINFAFFGSYCLGRLFCIPISQKLHPSVIIMSALTLCCLSSAFLSVFGGSSLEALLVGNAVMGLSISFQFPSGLTWLASEMPGGMKSIYTSFMFTGANCGWIVLPPLASTLFYVISPSAPFVTALICNLIHMIIFIAMHKLSLRQKSMAQYTLNQPD